MRMRIMLLLALMTELTLGQSQGQGFVNLNFEQANVSGYTAGSLVPTAFAFPGWQVSYGTTQASQVYYDGMSFDGPEVSLVDSNNPYFGPIQGNYSALLFNAMFTGTETLSQTGLIPNGATGIQLDANEQLGSFAVTIGGQTISMTPLQTYSDYTVYGGDISAFANQTETLSITELESNPGGFLLLDNITFTSPAIPEPGKLALIVMGGVAVGAGIWRKRSKVRRS